MTCPYNSPKRGRYQSAEFHADGHRYFEPGEVVVTTAGIGNFDRYAKGGSYLVTLFGEPEPRSFSAGQVSLPGVPPAEPEPYNRPYPVGSLVMTPSGYATVLSYEAGTILVETDSGDFQFEVADVTAATDPFADGAKFEPGERISFSVADKLAAGRTKAEARTISEAVAGINSTEGTIRSLVAEIRRDLGIVEETVRDGNMYGRDAIGRRAPDLDRAFALREVHWRTLAGLVEPAVVNALASRNAPKDDES